MADTDKMQQIFQSIMDAVGFQLLFAVVAHGDQRYGNDTFDNEKCVSHPFEEHLIIVLFVLWIFGIRDLRILRAACGHDLFEDTKVRVELLMYLFDAEEVGVMYACTDGNGDTRELKKQAAYRKIRLLWDAQLVKLADRIANVWSMITTGSDFFFVYKREHEAFAAELFDPTNKAAYPMWWFLNGMFREAFVDEYWGIHQCDEHHWARVSLAEKGANVLPDASTLEIIQMLKQHGVKIGP